MFFQGIELLAAAEALPDQSYLNAAALLHGFENQPEKPASQESEEAPLELAA